MRAVLASILIGSVLAGGATVVDGAAAARAAPARPPSLAAAQEPSGPAQPRPAFGWPLPGIPPVLRAFDPPGHRYGPGHRGVDLGGVPGQPVLAAGAGVVFFTWMVAGRPVLSIDHPNGLRTTYEPVVATVAAGQPVQLGQPIGALQSGHPGCPATCLHWGLRRGEEYLDPLVLLSVGPVRLLPSSSG